MVFAGPNFTSTSQILGYNAHEEQHLDLNFKIPSYHDFRFIGKIANNEGVYIFYAKKNFLLNLLLFSLFTLNASKMNRNWKGKIKIFSILKIKKGQVFYIGSSKDKVLSRAREHLCTKNNNGTSCLRLGRLNRQYVKKYLGLVIVETTASMNTTVETALRQSYLPLFSNS